jgi:Gpi18-like mannosyltransferase/predicted membrane-bound dolichyl-phosphate-mannose-protein mannosyltransferase
VSTTKAGLQTGVRTEERTASSLLRISLLLALGFVLRLLFMGNEGFKNDVSSFEAWALTLVSHPFSAFYESTSFADYPPGYFYILAAVGHVYQLIAPHGNYDVLKYMVKVPAVVMDLVDGVLLYAIVRRFASERWALLAAAIYIINPAVIFMSAAWGQVDSVSGGLALFAIYLLLRSDDIAEGAFPWAIVGAWLALSYSLLIKPQAAILIPLLIVFAFVSPERRRERLAATGAGIVGAILLAFALTVPFHPTANPVNAFAWLYDKYSFGKNVYAYNSVNAFNLWAIIHPFWQSDSALIGMWPQYFWGILLVAAATVLVLVRYAQARTQMALIEAAALLTLAFFMLSTRMHERYVFDGLLFTIAAIAFARRYLAASLIFTGTLFINLFYSLQYLSVVTNHTPGIDPYDMWPGVTHVLSAINVATFFYLGYVYLGQSVTEADVAENTAQAPAAATQPVQFFQRARSWFNPREGLAAMVWPLDYALAGAFGVISFIVSYINYWLPNEKIFDEIYFARAGEEYLTGKYIYENTHPPLTKLIITLSTMMFGGMAHGDNPYGWRFLDVVFGAIVIVIIYAFAKRLTRSTLFASFAAILFTADGMHFVQSRIATPEGIVIVFSLGTLYAFYRYWIASQSTVRKFEPNTLKRAGIALAGAIVLGIALSAITNALGHGSHASFIVFSVYFTSGCYLALRRWVVPLLMKPDGELATYAEGSRMYRNGAQFVLETPDGGVVDSQKKNPSAGELSRVAKTDLVLKQDEATITYAHEGTATYATPVGSATFAPGRLVDDEGEIEEGRHATGWLIAFTVLLGALVASKWYGVMAYGVSFVVIAAVWLQRYLREGKPKRWGNPYGFRLDLAIAAIVFLSMTVYLCVWIPDLVRQVDIKNLSDLVYRQYSMFMYHDTLKATHPYASKWWSWPLDLRPIAYYWKDLRTGLAANSPTACCVAEVISLPNPLILWFGLATVPLVAYLALREKNKGYALLVLAYLLQWLPWAKSPRLAWIYHFYVDVPLIVLCNVIILQRLWNWDFQDNNARLIARLGVCGYVTAVVLAFIWFYPILAGVPLPWDQWNARMWLHEHWV